MVEALIDCSMMDWLCGWRLVGGLGDRAVGRQVVVGGAVGWMGDRMKE